MAEQEQHSGLELADEQEALLCEEGLMSKGYGLIPKLVMTYPDLSITAKAIYAYLRSLAGNGTTAFPSVKNITYTLNVNKDTFYKHFATLKETALCLVKHTKSESSHFANNIYVLASQSPVLVCPRQEELTGENILHGKVVPAGLNRDGYGMIPRLVMQDERLSHKAKAAYAYICSFAGAGTVAFPARDTILYHLGISHPVYYRLLHELIDLNYITVKQRKVAGRFSVCDYYLVDQSPPCERFSETEKPDTGLSETGKSDAELSDAAKPYTEPSEAGKPPTISNSSKKNSSKSNSVLSNSPSSAGPDPEEAYIDWCVLRDCEPETIPERLREIDRTTIEDYIAKDIGLDIIEILNPEETRRRVRYLIKLVVEALFYPKLRVSGSDYPPEEFIPRLLALGLEEYQFVLEKVSRTSNVKNLKAYYLACLFNSHEDLEMVYQQAVESDLGN